MANTLVLLQLETYTSGLTLSFLLSSLTRFLKEIKKINPLKVAQSTDVPVEILKNNADIFVDYIYWFFNESLNFCKFPTILKRANVTPVFEKGFRGCKEN